MKQITKPKLRIVTRRDLPFGDRATQSSHAAIDFTQQFPSETNEWHKESNYLALLTVADEPELIKLIHKAESLNIKHSVFREPDLDNQITAVAFEPSDEAKRITSSCPLLGKELITNNQNI